MKRVMIYAWNVLKEYLRNCTLHGARYLVDNDLSRIERFFWLISCAICWGGCANKIRAVVNKYVNDPAIVISTDTTYLDWRVPLPSVFFCIKNTAQIKNKYKYFAQQPGTLESPYGNKSASVIKKTVEKVSSEELLEAYEEMKIPCELLLRRCVWNDVELDCCKELFRPLFKTGVGYCLAANSLHTGSQRETPRLNLYVDRFVRHSDLIIDITMNSTTKPIVTHMLNIYVTNNNNVPFIYISDNKVKLKTDLIARLDFTMMDMYNEDSLRNVPIRQRMCRFADEVDDARIHYMYSMSSCIVELLVRRMIQMCGCVMFYYPTPTGARVCNMTEMECIFRNRNEIKSKEAQKSTCFPNCEGTSVSVNNPSYRNKSPDDEVGRLHLKMLTRPLLRFRRYVVFDSLDLVVAVGSAFSLFVGASVLSFFELPYWLFVHRENKNLARN
ncbi:sodium channel protein Nach isoform X2 [Pseudomyrmex gracilis]|uniref:sodium channel protein Nach isoform X2 n=1 Tax=Pseudomyrmex gracilis TaxID=219809 RepID=UPI0009957EE9|nr:sodium channel protein Nach isoform X2 [Pseudomyrmex gracilis]